MKISALLLLLSTVSFAGSPEFWGKYPDKSPEEIKEIRAWFPTVMQPGYENQTGVGRSCCGEADAFEARILGEDPATGNVSVIIDDGKSLIPDGYQVSVPRDKLQWHYGNLVGKVIIFMSGANVYCLIPLSGI